MPKVNVYLPDELATAVREAQIPVSAVCQAALLKAVRDMTAARAADDAPPTEEDSGVGLFGRFTPRARQAVVLAEGVARAGSHNYVGTEHVLLGILDEGDNLALKVLARLDVDPEDLRAELRGSMGPEIDEVPVGHIPFTVLAKRSLESAAKEALRLGHNYLGCEHLFLGILATEDGLGSKVLRRMGIELRTTRQAVTQVLAGYIADQLKVAAPAAAQASSSPSQATLDRILERLDAIERRLEP